MTFLRGVMMVKPFNSSKHRKGSCGSGRIQGLTNGSFQLPVVSVFLSCFVNCKESAKVIGRFCARGVDGFGHFLVGCFC